MQRCGCCRRYLLTGETFRLYRRRFRKSSVIVCAQCRLSALAMGWTPLHGQVYRQMTRRPRVFHLRRPVSPRVGVVAVEPEASPAATNSRAALRPRTPVG